MGRWPCCISFGWDQSLPIGLFAPSSTKRRQVLETFFFWWSLGTQISYVILYLCTVGPTGAALDDVLAVNKFPLQDPSWIQAVGSNLPRKTSEAATRNPPLKFIAHGLGDILGVSASLGNVHLLLDHNLLASREVESHDKIPILLNNLKASRPTDSRSLLVHNVHAICTTSVPMTKVTRYAYLHRFASRCCWPIQHH